MSDLAATLRRIADDPRNSIRSADKLLIEEAARELERLETDDCGAQTYGPQTVRPWRRDTELCVQDVGFYQEICPRCGAGDNGPCWDEEEGLRRETP